MGIYSVEGDIEKDHIAGMRCIMGCFDYSAKTKNGDAVFSGKNDGTMCP